MKLVAYTRLVSDFFSQEAMDSAYQIFVDEGLMPTPVC
jgi:hypothetical protein